MYFGTGSRAGEDEGESIVFGITRQSNPTNTGYDYYTSPIADALHGRPRPAPTFEPSSLLVVPGHTISLLTNNPPDHLTEPAYKKWIKSMKLTQAQSDTLDKNIAKTLKWWKDQPDQAAQTIQRVFVAMGIDATKIKPGTPHETMLKIMTTAMTCAC